MYSSLDKIDIAAEKNGAKIAIQTDHRTQDEIDERFELSVIFAIARAVNPIVMSDEEFHAVRFMMASKPSARFVDVLTLSGAEVEEEGGMTHAAALDESKRIELVRRALRSIGAEVLERHNVGPSREGLVSLQAAVHKRFKAGGPENEIEYWTNVIELGAATGVVLEEMFGGDWEITTKFYSTLPFVFETGSGEETLTINAFGKVERFANEGESEAPSNLITMMEQSKLAADVEPKALLTFRPKDWAGAETAVFEPLLKNDKKTDVDIPLVALIHDLPEAIRTIPKDTAEDERKSLWAEALGNIKQMHVDVEQVEGELPMCIIHGGYYAGEKILDSEFMLGLQQRLETDAVMVAIPLKGVAFVTSAMAAPEKMGAFCMLAQEQYKDAPSNERISPTVFMFLDGKPVAFASPSKEK